MSTSVQGQIGKAVGMGALGVQWTVWNEAPPNLGGMPTMAAGLIAPGVSSGHSNKRQVDQEPSIMATPSSTTKRCRGVS